MKSIKSFLYFIIGAIIFCSCDDIIEPDISTKQVEIKSPADGVMLQTLTPTFSWNSVDGATKYNIQIAYPSFDSVQTLYDTIVSKTTFTKQLRTGFFEWKVRAVNNNYYGKFTDKRKFAIDSSLNIANQTVTLISPTSNLRSIDSNLVQTLTWESLSIAKSYNIKITDVSANNTVVKYAITDTKYQFIATKEGAYSWSVQAIDADFVSNKFNTPETFYIDRTKPQISTTINLAKDTTLTLADSALTITWTSSDTKLLKGDSIYVYNSDSTTLNTTYLPQYFAAPNAQTYTIKKPVIGTYWIKLVSIDAAGNRTRTKKRKFKIS